MRAHSSGGARTLALLSSIGHSSRGLTASAGSKRSLLTAGNASSAASIWPLSPAGGSAGSTCGQLSSRARLTVSPV
eukprot:10390865-Lingulodinium_polyedra.AAC.1